MHITKIEEFSFSHGEHFNTTTGEYHSLNPHTLGRPLTHTEMDYNLIYQKQTLNGFRICGSNNDLTLALSDLGARLEFKQISSTDADWARFQAAGLFDGQFVWNPVGGALPTTTTTTAAPTTTTTTAAPTTTTTTTAAPTTTTTTAAPTTTTTTAAPTTTTTTAAPTTTTTTAAPTTTTTTAAPTYTASTLFNHSAATTNHEMQTPLNTDVGTSHTISNSGLAAGATISHTVYLVADTGWEFDYSGLQISLGGTPIDLNNQPAGVTITNPSPTQIRIQRDYVNIQSNVSSTMNIIDVQMTAITTTTTTAAPTTTTTTAAPVLGYYFHGGQNNYPANADLTAGTGVYFYDPGSGFTQTNDFDLAMSYIMDNLGTMGNGVGSEYDIIPFNIPAGGIPALGNSDELIFPVNDTAERYYIILPDGQVDLTDSTAMHLYNTNFGANTNAGARRSFTWNGQLYWIYKTGFQPDTASRTLGFNDSPTT